MVRSTVVEVWSHCDEVEGCAGYDMAVGKLAGLMVAYTCDRGLGP